jgi:hypothetical protein
MKGRDREARVAAPEPIGETLAQVARRLAGEGQNEQLLWSCDLVFDQPDGALDDDSRLPRTGASQHDCRPIGMCDSGLLMGI